MYLPCTLTIYLIISTVCCQQLPMIADKSVVDISLANYNVRNPDGESREFMYFVKPYSTCVIQVVDVPEDVHFVLVQVHSYLKNITLSYNKEPTRNTSVTGINIGLLKWNVSPVLTYYLSYNSSFDNVTIMIAVQAYSINAPVPGGCNMEFQVEISPFLKTIFDKTVTEVDFAPASPPSYILSNPFKLPDDLCNVKPHLVTYKMYRLYLSEGNVSDDLYFESIKSMSTRGRILKNGRRIPDKYGPSPMRHFFASYPRIGSVFVVIAESQMGTSVYVPSFTHSCWIDQESNSCRVLTTTFSKLLCASIVFLGLFVYSEAHRLFRIELLIFGFITGTILGYIVARKLNGSAASTISAGVGLSVMVTFVFVCCGIALPFLSHIIATTLLGFLIASFVLYLLDVYGVLISDTNYQSIFYGIMFLCPILMISLQKKANTIASSIIGSYISISAIDYCIGSNLRFIVFNMIRSTDSRFRYAITDPPFQTKDIALTLVWAVFATLRHLVQWPLVEDRQQYSPDSSIRPNSSNSFWSVVLRYRTAVSHRQSSPTETAPLLRSTRLQISGRKCWGERENL